MKNHKISLLLLNSSVTRTLNRNSNVMFGQYGMWICNIRILLLNKHGFTIFCMESENANIVVHN